MRVLIVDDERIARNRLRFLLSSEPDIDAVVECADGRQAILALEQSDFDVLFLDIQMPGADGMEVARAAAAAATRPLIVFVTAYSDHAVEAFAVRAFDYLLKPFDRERFQKTLDNVRAELSRGRTAGTAAGLNSLLKAIDRRRDLERLAVRNRGNVVMLETETIDWIEAADNYACIHCGATTHVLRETMGTLETRLDANRFVRIHRSAIVNVARIRELQPSFRGDSRVVLHDGTTLTLSRTYRERLHNALFGSAGLK